MEDMCCEIRRAQAWGENKGSACEEECESESQTLCVYYLQYLLQSCSRGGGGGYGGHVLRETTSPGRCELVCPSRTNERGGEGYCVKDGGGEEGERERERAGEVRLYYSLGC